MPKQRYTTEQIVSTIIAFILLMLLIFVVLHGLSAS